MFLLYLDDSGSASNANEEHLVLGGVLVSERQVNDLTHRLDLLAEEYHFADPDMVEFHASAIWARKMEPWKSIDPPSCKRVIHSVLKTFAAAPLPACAVACAVHKSSYPDLDPMGAAFRVITESFDRFLRARHLETGYDERGMIFIDEKCSETTLRQIARDFRRAGVASGSASYIADVPHFVSSKNTRCVQYADHVAYAVFRAYHAKDHDYLDVVLNRFLTDGSVMYGLQHLHAEKADCTCAPCLTHRSSAGKLLKV